MAEVVALNLPMHGPNILLVEDSASDALLIRSAITAVMPGNSGIRHEKTLEATLKALSEAEYDVVLLDLSLPDSTGFDGLLSIQNLAPKLPVIILTAYADEELALQAVEHGAQDYLFKDRADGKAIRRAMQYAVQRKQFESTLIKQANFDTLTKLANRVLFESRLDMALARMRRANTGVGVFFLDLNNFKEANDMLGHAAGDALLQQVAERLRQCLRPYDTASRFGGDEFALLVEGIGQARDCAVIAQKIIMRMAEPFPVEHKTVNIGISIGIVTCFTGNDTSREALLKQADEAMYGAKLSGRSNYRFYTPEVHEEACARLKLERELGAAIVRNELTLHYQPKLDLRTGRTTGAEALIRWNHPVRGLLLPSEFMAVAAETGLVREIGEWVLSAVCADIARWRKAGLPAIQVSVNISTAQLDDVTFPEILQTLLGKHVIPPTGIAVEIPSSAILDRAKERIKTLEAIRRLGVEVHLDHFGTSAFSLAALKTLAVDAVKIAPDLTRTINEPDGMLALVQAIMDIAERFKVGVVAGGIENEWQRSFFKEQSCREGQGYALCRPVPGEYIPDWLMHNHN